MEFIIIILLILLNGIFSMSEIALISSRKFKLENAAKRGDKKAKKALALAKEPNTFLSTVQIGITLIAILTGVFSSDDITASLQLRLMKVETLAPYADTIAVVVVVFIVTFLTIVFGELIPKRIGLLFPERIAKTMAAPMNVLSKVASPFIWLLSKTNEGVLRLFGIKETKENQVTEEEIKSIIQESTRGGEIQLIEQTIVERVFALGDRRVSELMTHRSDLVWLDINDNLETVKMKARAEQHNMYPVADGSLDKLVGMVSVKEIFPKVLDPKKFNLQDYIKKPLIIHEGLPAYRALEKFKEYRTHYALIVDEYGVIEGLVSMDDILDALLGDVSDEDQEEYKIVERAEGSWLADGQYPYFELLHYFGIEEEDGTDGDFNTLGGLILHEMGKIPAEGESMDWNGLKIEVVDMDGARIDKVMITRMENDEDEEE